jgi:hypothetical protein
MTRKSQVLAALMFVVDFFSALFKELKKRGVTEEAVFDALKSKNDLIPKMAEQIADLIADTKATTKGTLRILANLTLTDRIARGRYDWVNSDITEEHFPTSVPADYDVEYKLFHFNHTISSDDAIKEMEKEGFRPGTLVELLALGETNPELQKQFPIVALGSTWQSPRGHRYVPCLYWGGSGRGLGLRWFGIDWVDVCRFLAVRK